MPNHRKPRSKKSKPMESYHGLVLTPKDAIVLLEAARSGLIRQVNRRLTDYERVKLVQNGAVFIWSEDAARMRRWTDGRNWSASRVNGVFLTYREMEGSSKKNRGSVSFKGKGLVKQSFSVMTKDGSKMHVVSYVDSDFNHQEDLARPSLDPQFAHIRIDTAAYPQTLFEESNGKFVMERKRPAEQAEEPVRKRTPVPIAPLPRRMVSPVMLSPSSRTSSSGTPSTTTAATTASATLIAPAPAPAPAPVAALLPLPATTPSQINLGQFAPLVPAPLVPAGATHSANESVSSTTSHNTRENSPGSPLVRSRRSSVSSMTSLSSRCSSDYVLTPASSAPSSRNSSIGGSTNTAKNFKLPPLNSITKNFEPRYNQRKGEDSRVLSRFDRVFM